MTDLHNPSGTFAPAVMPKVAWGQGCYVYDVKGKQYIDGSGGPSVFCLGHGNEEVNDAVKRQLDRIAHGYRYLFTSDPLEELTRRIGELTGGLFSNAVYVTGGSEAVESCLKLALQHAAATGQRSRRRFIARERSWHGNTLGALSVSHFLERRRAFEGALIDTQFVSAANAYRPPDGVGADELAQYLADELDRTIESAGAETIAAFIFEPVVGAAGGVVPAPDGYAARIRQVCDNHGILMIADEVMCGAGRCGTWRALEHDAAVPDIMAVAKGLAGGYQPLGAALYSERIASDIMAAHGGPMTGHTFTGHTTACAAGCAVQEIINREHLVERVRKRGARFLSDLRASLGHIEAVGDVRGRGYFIGIELVAERESKCPFPRQRMLFQKIGAAALEDGLICYPCSGNVDGVLGDTVILSPPYNASDRELDEIADKFVHALERVLAQA